MSVSPWEQRQLCPDGACVGVIGDDGLCKVCGKVAPNWGDERRRGLEDGASEETRRRELGTGPIAKVAGEEDEGDDGDEDDDDDDDEYEDDDGEGDGGDDDGEESDDDDDDDDDEGEGEPDDGEPAPVRAAAATAPRAVKPAAADDWKRRRLCSDDACIGVIAANGRCGVCGKPARG